MNRKLPEVLDSTHLFDAFFSVRKDRLLYPNQNVADYFVVSTTKESVAIIATTKDNRILVTEEYRHPVKSILLGCPGGLVEESETVLAAAKRELLEETGCTADCFELLGSCCPLPGILAQKMAIVHARNVHVAKEPTPDANELIQCHFLPIDTLKEQILNKDAVDGVLCSAFLYYLLSRQDK